MLNQLKPLIKKNEEVPDFTTHHDIMEEILLYKIKVKELLTANKNEPILFAQHLIKEESLAR